MKKKSSLTNLKSCVKGNVLPTVLTPVFIIFEVALEVFIPLLMAAIVDGGLKGKTDYPLAGFIPAAVKSEPKTLIITLGVGMIIAALCSLAFGMLASRTAAIASMRFAANLRKKLFLKVTDFSFKNTDKYSTPSLVTRLTTDVTSLQNTYQQLIRMFVRAPAMIIFAAVMAFNINAELSMIFVFAIPVLGAAIFFMIKFGFPRFKVMLKKYDGLNASVQENVIAAREVKSYVREDYEKEKFDKSVEELKQAQLSAEKIFTLSIPVQLAVMYICTIFLLLFGGKTSIFDGGIGEGELVSLLTYSTQIVNSLSMVSFMFVTISLSKASLVRINEVLNEQPDIVGSDSDELKVETGEIEFKNVNFSYSGDVNNLTLQDINLHFLSGETVGIIAGTGDGKSTLVQLIPRFYDATEGEVLVGGRNVKEYSLYELRESVSMVLQKNLLFSGTIEENLRWGNPSATDEEIKRACELACASDFVEAFPNGYETDLGQGGVNVSGGQKQRLCIARALLKKPKILILDDSTSAVDTATDKKIRKALREFMPGTTKVVIAQRIASVMDCDKIVVMDKGRISAVGTHDELMERSEIYREVFNSQQGGKN
ncbi:MAG: ABC transporter ATP-binding protein/permease [Christensenellaceae bacterium]|nr:ABC transporter ATP-binding protein/permease [Christensenellaceae bacterium]MDD6927631.1 ABC transporter ATP-binding protein [bacterium]MDY2851242.1 ABC transporter ATP-binding protein [Christensenellaceae bacterium]